VIFCNILNMYADAGLTHLRDGSIFFGLLPCALKVEQKVEDLKTMVIRTADEEIKRVNCVASAAAAECASAAGTSAGEAESSSHVLHADHVASETGSSALGRDDDSRDARERARRPLAPAGHSSDDAAADTPAADAGARHAAVHAGGGGGSDSRPVGDSCFADADLSASAAVADSSETTAAEGGGSDINRTDFSNDLRTDVMNARRQPVAVKAEQETGGHGCDASSSSSAAAAASSLLPARQLRLPRVLPSSSSPTASGFKSSRYTGDSATSSLKAAATQPEQDNLFIRSATAPPIECFNPVFHFQR